MKRTDLSSDQIVVKLYDIALDTQSLDSFIEAWNEAGLDSSDARQAIATIDGFDEAFRAHLNRAETFLKRDDDSNNGPDLTAALVPFRNLAAFVVDRSLRVIACNDGAQNVFGLEPGVGLSSLNLEHEMQVALEKSFDGVFGMSGNPDRLLKVEFPGNRSPTLFQIRRLPMATEMIAEHALVVTTQYHWQATLGQTLVEVFDLTTAEQSVVRALIEGLDVKTIALERGTSQSTVRWQIKSIQTKMDARSQSEVIRLVMALRDVLQSAQASPQNMTSRPPDQQANWLYKEVWKPFKTLELPDGRKMDYHDMGPPIGNPILLTHMGYCMARWHMPMLQMAFKLGLRVIVPIRAGYGHSDNMDLKDDVLEVTRNDTRTLLNHLNIDRLPFVPQGSDVHLAVDFAAHFPEMVSEIIGICARPCLPGDKHYARMGKWHRFFLSTAKHAPNLLFFTSKAAVSMAKRIGVVEMFLHMNGGSAPDVAVIKDAHLHDVLVANAELTASKSTNVAQAYAMELMASESDWSDLMKTTKDIPTRFFNADQDQSMDAATIEDYRDNYPWIDIEVIENSGQMLIYQHYKYLIPILTEAAKRA